MFWAALTRDSISLLISPFVSHIHVFLVRVVGYLSLKTSIGIFFFPCSFSGYFCSVVSIVSSGCDQCLSTLFCLVFESLYRGVNTVFNGSESPSSLFSWHIVCQRHPCDARPWCVVINFHVVWTISFRSSLVHSKNGLEYLTSGTVQLLIPFISFPPYSFVSSSFFLFSHFHMFDSVSNQNSPVFVGFLFSNCSDFFWIW